MTLEEANKKYSTLDGAIEYLSMLSKEFDKNKTELGSSEWLFETVIHTALINLGYAKMYQKKYGDLSMNDFQYLVDALEDFKEKE